MPEPDGDRFIRAAAAIDAANAEDPTTVVVRGVEGPKELLHGRLVVERVRQLDPAADELQLLAARAHHLRRWASPRSAHPDGRAGYLRWRAEARRRHAEDVRALLTDHGCTPDEADRVAAIVAKQHLGSDPAVQTHEDALCLVFLETQLAEVADRLGDDAAIGVLVKTLRKMSAAGRRLAREVTLEDRARAVLLRAMDDLGADGVDGGAGATGAGTGPVA